MLPGLVGRRSRTYNIFIYIAGFDTYRSVTLEKRIIVLHQFSGSEHLRAVYGRRFFCFNSRFGNIRCFRRSFFRSTCIDTAVIPFLEYAEGLEKGLRNLFAAVFGFEDGQVRRIGHETDFYQDGRHCGLPEDEKRILPYSTALAHRSGRHCLVHIFREEQTLFKMGVLHEVKKDERFRIGRVKALIFGGIVILKHHHRVFALADIHVVSEQVTVLFRRLPQDMD